jgi:hypothetical protein
MTVDQLWYEVLQTIDDKSNPDSVAGKHLRKLIEATQGQGRFRRGIKEKLKQKKLPLLRLFAQIIDPSEQLSVQLHKDVRRDLLEESVNVAAVFAEKDSVFWRFRWLQLASGQSQIAARLSQELHRFSDGCGTPGEMANRFKALSGWADFPKDRWVELFEKARDSELSVEFRSHLQKVVEVLRGWGGQPPAKPSATQTPPPAVPVPAQPVHSGPLAPEPPQVKTVVSQPATAAAGNRPRVPESTVGIKPPDDTPSQSGEPPVPNEAVEAKPGSEQHQATDPPVPTSVPPQPGEDIVALAGGPPEATPAGAKQEASAVKEARPKKAAARKTASKEAAVATSPTEPATGHGLLATVSSGPAKPSPEGKPQAADGGELSAVLTELASAVREISGRLDQIASRTGDGATLEQRLVELERRLARVERALTDTQSDAQRARDEAERLRDRLSEQDRELADAIRERDSATNRADELAQKVASASDQIKRAEDRADQNIHEAFRERDEALRTFKARLWDLIQAQLSDVTDPTPGEEFASIEEEVLTTRLRSIRDTLRAEGVPP